MKFTITILLFFSLNVTAQVKIDSINRVIYLDQVHDVEGDSKSLKDKAFEWVATAYNNSNYVIRLNTDDKIITKGFLNYYDSKFAAISKNTEVDLKYTLELSFKDNKYRIEINNIDSEDVRVSLMNREEYKDFALIKSIAVLKAVGMTDKQIAKGLKKSKDVIESEENYTKYTDNIKTNILRISKELEDINNSLLAHMKSSSDEDDW